MLLDAEQDQGRHFASRVFDVCICGSGPAGITLALSLAAKGHTVALMEGGGLEVTAESQDLYRGENVGLPYLPIDACRLRYLGGSSNHWGGFTRPLDARDFGPLPQHSLNAWPIAKPDLDIYAKRTAEILDLPAAVAPRDIFGGKEEMLSPAVYRVSPVQMAGKYQDELTRSPLVSLCLNANLVDIELASDLRTVSAMVFRSYAREQQFKVAAR
jgi:hypothetical protein